MYIFGDVGRREDRAGYSMMGISKGLYVEGLWASGELARDPDFTRA